jgi:uncharacterized protein YkwD
MLTTLRHLFFPHESNNHRPKTLHPAAIIFYVIFLIFIQATITVFERINPNILGYASNITVNDLLTITNQKRVENKLPHLTLNTELNNAAAGKAQDMFTKNYWAHNAPDGTPPWVFVTGAGYNYLYAGENLAKDFGDSMGVVNAWMDSSTHRQNILNSKYKDIGFAVVNGKLNGEETTLVVQFFGTTAGGTPQTTQVAAAVANPSPTIPIPTSKPVQVTIMTPTPTTALPTVTPILIAQLTPAPPSLYQATIVKPTFDSYKLTKTIAVLLALLLLTILGIDGISIYRHKIVRLSGHNFAHMMFLTILLVTMYFLGRGSIL